MLEQVYSDVRNLSCTLERYNKMLAALKQVARECNEITAEQFQTYQSICYHMDEMQSDAEIIMLGLQSLMQDKEG